MNEEKVDVPKSPRIVVVAEDPMYIGPSDESCDVEAPANSCWSAVHVLAWAVLRVIEGETDPTTVNPVHDTPDVHEADEVPTLARVLGPEKYARLPTTAADEVESPFHESALPVRANGNETERGP